MLHKNKIFVLHLTTIKIFNCFFFFLKKKNTFKQKLWNLWYSGFVYICAHLWLICKISILIIICKINLSFFTFLENPCNNFIEANFSTPICWKVNKLYRNLENLVQICKIPSISFHSHCISTASIKENKFPLLKS